MDGLLLMQTVIIVRIGPIGKGTLTLRQFVRAIGRTLCASANRGFIRFQVSIIQQARHPNPPCRGLYHFFPGNAQDHPAFPHRRINAEDTVLDPILLGTKFKQEANRTPQTGQRLKFRLLVLSFVYFGERGFHFSMAFPIAPTDIHDVAIDSPSTPQQERGVTTKRILCIGLAFEGMSLRLKAQITGFVSSSSE